MRDKPPNPESLDQFQQRLLRESRALIEKSERLLQETADLVQPAAEPERLSSDQGDARQDTDPRRRRRNHPRQIARNCWAKTRRPGP